MGTDDTPTPNENGPPMSGRFSWIKFVVWLAVAPVLGAIAALVAVSAQFFFAPLLIFPILIGIGLGGMLVGLQRVAQVGHRPTLWLGAVVAAAAAIGGQHYISYREARSRIEQQEAENILEAQQKAPNLPPEFFQGMGPRPPANFAEYMRHQAADGRPIIGQRRASGTWAWVSWAIDGLLLLLAAGAVMIPASRQPFCNRCQSWYRTVRGGKISPLTARQVAEAGDMVLTERVKSARCRLSNCSSGCGLTRLELSWEEPDGRTYLNTVWLDADRRDRIGRLLDDENG